MAGRPSVPYNSIVLWVPLLLVACVVAGAGCARVCRAALAADRPAAGGGPVAPAPELTLREAAFLAGGPLRVTDLTLVTMHRARRLLLAHTGWATVVDASGGDALEREVVGAIGPGGQCPVDAVRPVVAAAEPVRLLEEGLVARGLAVPAAERRAFAAGVRTVRGAFLLALLLGVAAALLVPAGERTVVVSLFTLPVVASGLCLLIGRVDVYPQTRWASPAGQRLLSGLSSADPLTAFATRGPGVLEPELRAALGSRAVAPA